MAFMDLAWAVINLLQAELHQEAFMDLAWAVINLPQ
jgi:hypothetical protein